MGKVPIHYPGQEGGGLLPLEWDKVYMGHVSDTIPRAYRTEKTIDLTNGVVQPQDLFGYDFLIVKFCGTMTGTRPGPHDGTRYGLGGLASGSSYSGDGVIPDPTKDPGVWVTKLLHRKNEGWYSITAGYSGAATNKPTELCASTWESVAGDTVAVELDVTVYGAKLK